MKLEIQRDMKSKWMEIQINEDRSEKEMEREKRKKYIIRFKT